MLFKQEHLKGIKSGNISLAFRKWEKLKIKTGSQIKTAIGIIEIGNITIVTEKEITKLDIEQSGFTDLHEVIHSLRQNKDAQIYKIQVSYYGEDPRIKLRSQESLSDEYFEQIKNKLNRLDQLSRQGQWAIKILNTIQDNPHLRAVKIGDLTGFEKEWLKLNIRKLKNIGLTISHDIGYEISALGKAFLNRFNKDN